MPGNRLVVALAVVALAGTIGPAASAKAGGNGNGNGSGNRNGGKQPSVSSYGNHNDVTSCLPGADTCTASGTVDVTTGALHSQSDLRRTTVATGREVASDLAYDGEYFQLRQPATSVTVTFRFTGVQVAGTAGAQSSDNRARAIAEVGGSITDSGCATYGCGADTADQQVRVDDQMQQAGVTATPLNNAVNTPGKGLSQPPAETVTVTLSMPDGSKLPAGTISFAGYTFAYTSLGDPYCTPDRTPVALRPEVDQALPQQCTPDTAHTGSATTAVSATLASIDYSVTA